MNIFLVNSTIRPLKKLLVDFFIQSEKFSFIVVLNVNPSIDLPSGVDTASTDNKILKTITCDGLRKEELSHVVLKLIADHKPITHVLYIEDPVITQRDDFFALSIPKLKESVQKELVLKINFFQILLQELKLEDPPLQILISVPAYAQTSLVTKNIEQRILFTSLHMVTTAIADEFKLYGITCNGVVVNEHVVDSLQWLLFEKKEGFTGKLISNKKIVEW